MRQDGNDPQVQLAEDVAAAMDAGATSADIVPQTSVDMSKSLSPFVLIYDKSNKLSGSDVVLGTTKPEIPSGALDTARSNGSHRFTWEPQSGTRAAVVAMKDKNGNIVVVGRSLREIESRTQQMMMLFGGALAVALIGTFMMVWMMEGGLRKQPTAVTPASKETPTAPTTHTPEPPATPVHDHHDHETPAAQS
jgi:metal-dependent hydrolase (beta-lactamase superfamily II)